MSSPEFDEPLPRIAVLGAGPIGLEAALYGRFLGYPVTVYERGDVAASVAAWGHVRMFSPFGRNSTSLGLAALEAQDPKFRPPKPDALLRGNEYREAYLLPLAQSDLLADCLRLGTRVVAVARYGLMKTDAIGQEAREEAPLVLLLEDAQGVQSYAEADIVLDCTGTFSNACGIGVGGLPALGENELEAGIERGLPDVLGAKRADYAGRHTLVIGSGYSAATSISSLAALQSQEPSTRITWVSPRRLPPLPRLAGDPLPERDRLAAAVNALAEQASGSASDSGGAAAESPVAFFGGSWVESIRAHADGGFVVQLQGDVRDQLHVDRVVANVGYRPDTRLFSELQVSLCHATEAPKKLAAHLLESSSGAGMPQHSHGVDALTHPEPDFYILGMKSYGRFSQFLLSAGFQQIRDVFTRIGERDDLDLYRTIKPMQK